MEPYKVAFKPSVEKDLRCLPHTVLTRVLSKIQQLKANPVSRDAVKISGAEHYYRVRVGDYRVIYSIDRDKMTIIIQYVRHMDYGPDAHDRSELTRQQAVRIPQRHTGRNDATSQFRMQTLGDIYHFGRSFNRRNVVTFRN